MTRATITRRKNNSRPPKRLLWCQSAVANSLRRNKHKTTKRAISCSRDWAMNVVVPFSAVECFRPHVAFFGCFYLDRRLYRDKVCLCLFLISSKSDSIWALRTIHRSQSQLSNYKCRSASLRIISACVLRAKLKNKQTRSLDNFIKWNGVVWEECAASKPRFPPPKHTRTAPVYGGHLLRRDFFMWTSYSFIGCREKCCVYHWVRFLYCDELRVGVAGLRREKQHGHGVVNRWILTSVWGSRVSGGASCHWRYEPSQKCVCVYFFFPPSLLFTHPHTLYGKRASH